MTPPVTIVNNVSAAPSTLIPQAEAHPAPAYIPPRPNQRHMLSVPTPTDTITTMARLRWSGIREMRRLMNILDMRR
jgi:hypothetical protein